MIPPAVLTEIGGGVGSILYIKKNTWISWIHPVRVLAAYRSSDRRISNNTNGKTEKEQYNNTKFIVLDSGVAFS